MVWYIPHHGVYSASKPDKIRVVFYCSAKCQGVSLNDKLLQGPNPTNSLIGVLLRFRQGPIAIMGDIEAMFHQVRVRREDRDLLRFLWWVDGDLNKAPVVCRATVHIFGATSSPSCANAALRATAEENKENNENCNSINFAKFLCGRFVKICLIGGRSFRARQSIERCL